MNKQRPLVHNILHKTISIIILDHEIEALKGDEVLGIKWQIRDNKTGKMVLTDRLEIIIIELSKAKRLYGKDTKNKIVQWMMFLDNPNKEEVVQIMGENKNIRKAIEELEQVSGDEKLQRIAELREKAIRDEHAALSLATKRGIEQNKIETAKNMLKENMNIELIEKITGLKHEEIEKIKKTLDKD